MYVATRQFNLPSSSRTTAENAVALVFVRCRMSGHQKCSVRSGEKKSVRLYRTERLLSSLWTFGLLSEICQPRL